MVRNKSINHILETMDRSVVKKYLQLPVKSYLLVTSGVVVLYFSSYLTSGHKNMFESLEIIVSIGLILWGFLLGVDEKHYFKHIKSGTKICFHEILFERKDFQRLIRIIETENFDELNSLHQTSGYSVKLRIAYSADKSFCLIQGIKYIPFEYAELTSVKQLDAFQTAKLFDIIGLPNAVSKHQRLHLI